MKASLIAVVLFLIVGCGAIPHLTPGVAAKYISEGRKVCENDGGLQMVSSTIAGYVAFCNTDNKMYYL